MVNRPSIGTEKLTATLENLRRELLRRVDQHGSGAYVSSHEISGTLHEETGEFYAAIHSNDRQQQINELFDIAVVCVFGIASISVVYGSPHGWRATQGDDAE